MKILLNTKAPEPTKKSTIQTPSLGGQLDIKIVCSLIKKCRIKMEDLLTQSKILKSNLQNNILGDFVDMDSAIRYFGYLNNQYNLYKIDYLKYIRLASRLKKESEIAI